MSYLAAEIDRPPPFYSAQAHPWSETSKYGRSTYRVSHRTPSQRLRVRVPPPALVSQVWAGLGVMTTSRRVHRLHLGSIITQVDLLHMACCSEEFLNIWEIIPALDGPCWQWHWLALKLAALKDRRLGARPFLVSVRHDVL